MIKSFPLKNRKVLKTKILEGDFDVYDVETKDTHTFLTSNYVITHNCFIKDMAAFREMYKKTVDKSEYYIFGLKFLEEMEEFNKGLLKSTGKDLDLLEGVYGKEDKK